MSTSNSRKWVMGRMLTTTSHNLILRSRASQLIGSFDLFRIIIGQHDKHSFWSKKLEPT